MEKECKTVQISAPCAVDGDGETTNTVRGAEQRWRSQMVFSNRGKTMTREQMLMALMLTAKECRERRICEGCFFNRGFNKEGKRKCALAKYPHNWTFTDEAKKEVDE